MRICALSEAVFASWSFRHIQMLVIRVRLWSCQPKRIQQLETLDAVTGRSRTHAFEWATSITYRPPPLLRTRVCFQFGEQCGRC